jgi:hypothetical protein
VSFLNLDPLPLARKRKVTAVDPPDVVTTGVDEFEFQVVRRCIAAYVKRELVVGRKVEGQCTACAGISGDAREVEVETEGLPLKALDRSERRPDAV